MYGVSLRMWQNRSKGTHNQPCRHTCKLVSGRSVIPEAPCSKKLETIWKQIFIYNSVCVLLRDYLRADYMRISFLRFGNHDGKCFLRKLPQLKGGPSHRITQRIVPWKNKRNCIDLSLLFSWLSIFFFSCKEVDMGRMNNGRKCGECWRRHGTKYTRIYSHINDRSMK